MSTNLLQPYVASPARVPVPYGLFSLAGLFRDNGADRFEGAGVRWQSFDGSQDLGFIGPVQTDVNGAQVGTVGLPKTFNSRIIEDKAGVFTVYGQMKITPLAWDQETVSAKAREILTTMEERAVERILWTNNTFDPSFMDAASAGASTTSLITAVATLEEYLSQNYGSLGVIHVSRANALRGLGTDQVFNQVNGRLFTKLGTPVVAGQGYDDTKMVCTGAILAYRSDIFENRGPAYGTMDTRTNDLYAIAERTYTIGWDSKSLAQIPIGANPA